MKICLTEPRLALVIIDMRPEDFHDIKLINRRNLSASLNIFQLRFHQVIEELSRFVVDKRHQPFATVPMFFFASISYSV